jgi:hypothetical protein
MDEEFETCDQCSNVVTELKVLHLQAGSPHLSDEWRRQNLQERETLQVWLDAHRAVSGHRAERK